jgi:hypothetical protein
MSPKKIKSLTPEQKARMAEYAARWTEIDLCTDPADRPCAEAAIREMYRQGGLVPPAKIVWCGSPMSMALTRATICAPHMLHKNAEIGRSVAESVENSVLDSVVDSAGDSGWKSVWDSVWHSVRDSVKDSVRHSVWCSVRDSVLLSIWLGVTVNVWHSIADNVGHSVRDAVCYNVYRSHDAGWLAFHRYFRDVVGLVEETDKLSGQWELAQSAGWAPPIRIFAGSRNGPTFCIAMIAGGCIVTPDQRSPTPTAGRFTPPTAYASPAMSLSVPTPSPQLRSTASETLKYAAS